MSTASESTTTTTESIALAMVSRPDGAGRICTANEAWDVEVSRLFPDMPNAVFRAKWRSTARRSESGHLEGRLVSVSSDRGLGGFGLSQVPYLLTWASRTLLPLKSTTNFGARLFSRLFLSVSLIGDFHAAYLVWPYGQLFDRYAKPVISITRHGGLHA